MKFILIILTLVPPAYYLQDFVTVEDKLLGCWLFIENDEEGCFIGDRVIFKNDHIGYTLTYKWTSDSTISMGQKNYLFKEVNDNFVKLTFIDSTNLVYHLKKVEKE